MSAREEIDEMPDDGPRLRRSLLGYRRADVDQMLSDREDEVVELEDELDSREAELTELRQDVAALWLAFAQHDRMIREIITHAQRTAEAARPAADAAQVEPTAPRYEPAAPAVMPEAAELGSEPIEPAPNPAEAAPAPNPAGGEPVLDDAEQDPGGEAEPSVSRQLAELDEVLAAIEMATQTLERTYADEIAAAEPVPEVEEVTAPDEDGPEVDEVTATPEDSAEVDEVTATEADPEEDEVTAAPEDGVDTGAESESDPEASGGD